MVNIPDTFQQRFDTILSDKGISIAHHSYYRKWLRFYFDFCHKYGHNESNPASLPFFKNKLREKNQKDFQINQAVHAVSLFYEIAAIPVHTGNMSGSVQNSENELKSESEHRFESGSSKKIPISKKTDSVSLANQSGNSVRETSVPFAEPMKAEDIEQCFAHLLNQKRIPPQCHYYYGKWLRYYLKFCEETGKPTSQKENLPLYSAKLKKDNYTDMQVKQACHAVSLYFDILRARNINDANCTQVQPNVVQNSEVQKVNPSVTDQHGQHCNVFNPPQKSIPPHQKANIVSTPDGNHSVNSDSWKSAFRSLYDEIKFRHYSPKTFRAYALWLGKFKIFTKPKKPNSLTDEDIKAFLTWLASSQNVSASTQNQAFNSLLFFFRHILKREPGELKNIVRAKRKPYIPVVLSKEEIELILKELPYPYDLIVKLLYGCGLRLFECLNLRIHNFNFDAGVLTVHDGKGGKDRTLPLPQKLYSELQAHIRQISELHLRDTAAGYHGTFMPNLLEKKYKNSAKELIWQWFFPAIELTKVPDTGELRRWHLHERHVQRAIRDAAQKARLLKRVSAHSFRHSFATHLMQANYDIRTIQELLGHSDIKTTVMYTHSIPSRTIKEAKSPLDF